MIFVEARNQLKVEKAEELIEVVELLRESCRMLNHFYEPNAYPTWKVLSVVTIRYFPVLAIVDQFSSVLDVIRMIFVEARNQLKVEKAEELIEVVELLRESCRVLNHYDQDDGDGGSSLHDVLATFQHTSVNMGSKTRAVKLVIPALHVLRPSLACNVTLLLQPLDLLLAQREVQIRLLRRPQQTLLQEEASARPAPTQDQHDVHHVHNHQREAAGQDFVP
nr:uncharacterized protein LOC106679187 [Halyomorpha halys]